MQVRRARAEELHGSLLADVVTARAVAPLDRLIGWCLPLVRPGGALLALKGEKATEELAAVAADLPRRGASAWSVEILGSGVVDPPTRVVRIVRSESASGTPIEHGRQATRDTQARPTLTPTGVSPGTPHTVGRAGCSREPLRTPVELGPAPRRADAPPKGSGCRLFPR